jgi:hypothetical protein
MDDTLVSYFKELRITARGNKGFKETVLKQKREEHTDVPVLRAVDADILRLTGPTILTADLIPVLRTFYRLPPDSAAGTHTGENTPESAGISAMGARNPSLLHSGEVEEVTEGNLGQSFLDRYVCELLRRHPCLLQKRRFLSIPSAVVQDDLGQSRETLGADGDMQLQLLQNCMDAATAMQAMLL